MLNIDSLALGQLQTNAYLLKGDNPGKAILIDPGAATPGLLRRLEQIEIEAILLTHAHFDHIGGVDEIRRLYNCPVYIHPLEAEWLSNPKLNGSMLWPDVTKPISTAEAEYDLAEGQQLSFLGETFTVLHLPGHSPGSVGFLSGNHLFGGDVLFRGGVGRTDLPGGREADLIHSIQNKLYSLPDEVIVYPGHGPRTTIGYEKQNNPYVK